MTTISIRDTIIKRIVTVIKAIEDTDGVGGPLFNEVERGSIDDFSVNDYPAVAVDAEPDEPSFETSFVTNKSMRVVIEFRFERPSADDGMDSFEKCEYYLVKLQQALLADQKLDNTAIDTQEAGSGSIIAGRNDPAPGGMLTLAIKYRHTRNDPSVRA